MENLRITATGSADGSGNSLDNTIYAGAGDNVMDGAGGTNTLSYYARGAVTASLADTGPQVTGGSGTDTILNFRDVYGSCYNDHLTGNSDNNYLGGGYGADTMTNPSMWVAMVARTRCTATSAMTRWTALWAAAVS